jgi:uncharacterized membrane protein
VTGDVVDGVVHYAAHTAPWMTWNLLLALIPWALAVMTFGRTSGAARARRLWWIGAPACLVFLPNAAYVLTDVIHLPRHVRNEPSDLVVIFGVLPMFGALFAVGLVAYIDIVRRMAAWTVVTGRARRSWPLIAVIHAVTAVGIYAGRVHRFNSWDLAFRPGAVISTTAGGFTRPLPLAAMAATFAVLAAVYAGCRAATGYQAMAAASIARCAVPLQRFDGRRASCPPTNNSARVSSPRRRDDRR